MNFAIFRGWWLFVGLFGGIAAAQAQPPQPVLHLQPAASRLALPVVVLPLPAKPRLVARPVNCALVAQAGQRAVAQERARRRIQPDVLLLQVWLGLAPAAR